MGVRKGAANTQPPFVAKSAGEAGGLKGGRFSRHEAGYWTVVEARGLRPPPLSYRGPSNLSVLTGRRSLVEYFSSFL